MKTNSKRRQTLKASLTLSAIACCAVGAASAQLQGTWYNSYCSRVDLTVAGDVIQGVYTSHTGSTGSSYAVGQFDGSASGSGTDGTPFSMGVQWRLINDPVSQADGSWHWVSLFSGQYFPAQTISEPDQDPYDIPETLEILNGLLATATVPGLNDTAPVLWPESLTFTKTPPAQCQPSTPGVPVSFTPTAVDNVSGTWTNADGDELVLTLGPYIGEVSGTFTSSAGDEYDVLGRYDQIAPPQSGYTVAAQGITLSLFDDSASGGDPALKIFAGGVDYDKTSEMFLYVSDLQSTSWTDRFIQQTLDKEIWTKQSGGGGPITRQ
ncbi:MAG: hypothetical protein AAGI89_04730 [Pseudomonadota bacterium]